MTEPHTQWSVQLSPSAVRALDRLPHKVAAAIVEFVTVTLPIDPYRLSKPLRFEFEGWRVARRGDYRVTFRALTDGHVLFIGRIEHRAHVYRR
ncbi:type II toxin-antitoxin system RelE/ParE family toxin [Mycobacterium xenopi]|uniref:Toxin RelE n=1 Tax=Mycobacterium xenopi TaxID=1789 RepID=A0AAD1H1P7_MYCXE|nr:type II toxin-antitoxin system RelE/ParE family toxin [Mycobacterium xenopi]EUA35821.1 toxin RelE [Mycobacterium xenopi 3993]MDA3641759.1 type II toxin-antitoxin system RelE/ParE family toxin [Mycobacterium xenopi]ORX20927.1 addiction module toxin RelE [Mycobacterium xenopi]BBU22620.1 toxin RelE [Mycobacterium xenopi]